MSKMAEESNNEIHTTIITDDDPTTATDAATNSNHNSSAVVATDAEEHPTSYMETLVHLFKGNIGPGLFAMGDAFKNGGLLVSPILTILIAFISVHCQHILLVCTDRVADASDMAPDYADTMAKCFARGTPIFRSWAHGIRTTVNVFICVTQLGFCCIYFVFITNNLQQVLEFYGIHLNSHLVMGYLFVPIWLASMVPNLKYLTPFSMLANASMLFGLVVTVGIALWEGVPATTERALYTSGHEMALFFGTAIFAFEGIALVLPLKNAMRKPSQFDQRTGVLNIGMTLITLAFVCTGVIGYWKWGDAVAGSLTLNLDTSSLWARAVKIAVSLGVMFGYPLQLYVAVRIMLPYIVVNCSSDRSRRNMELGFRTFLVLGTFMVAQIVPQLNLCISLIGAVCSSALALLFPPIMEMIMMYDNGAGWWLYTKDAAIVVLALFGFVMGAWQSLYQILQYMLSLPEIAIEETPVYT